jgi:hypothetical protein
MKGAQERIVEILIRGHRRLKILLVKIEMSFFYRHRDTCVIFCNYSGFQESECFDHIISNKCAFRQAMKSFKALITDNLTTRAITYDTAVYSYCQQTPKPSDAIY